MKQCILFIATLWSLNCSAITHLKPVDPIVISTNLPKEQVWQRLLGLFVSNNIPIKLMDKNSGLMQSERIGLGSHYTLKNADDSTCWALCEVVKNPEGDGLYLFPQTINGEIQVYVQETEGKVLLSINLMNLTATLRDSKIEIDRTFDIQSTKRLENIIGKYLQTYEQMPSLALDPPFATFGESPSQTQKRDSIALENAKKYQELLKLDTERWRKEREEREKKEENEKRLAPLYILGGIALCVLLLFAKINEKQ
jgi:hypothetical protein